MELADFLIAVQDLYKLSIQERVELHIWMQNTCLFVRVEYSRFTESKRFPYHEICKAKGDVFTPAVSAMIHAIKKGAM